MEQRIRWRAAAVALVSTVLFAWLAYAVVRGHAAAFDRAVRDTIHTWASPALTVAMRSLTWLGSTVFLIGAGGFVVWRLIQARRRAAALFLVVAALGGEALNQGLKLAFERPRPAVFFGLTQPKSYSFPSGHSMASCCFYGALALIAAGTAASRARRGLTYAAAAAVIVVVGFSRVYLGVHYPTDVAAGYMAGLAWLSLLRVRAATPPERARPV